VEVNISTKLKFKNILYGCLRQVGCLIKVKVKDKGKTKFEIGYIGVTLLDGPIRWQVSHWLVCIIIMIANSGTHQIKPRFVIGSLYG